MRIGLGFAALVLAACGGGDSGIAADAGSADAASDDRGWQARAEVLGGPLQETFVLTTGGLVYVLGGFAGFDLTDQILIYDPVDDTWSRGAPMPAAVHHANAAVVDGAIYVVGAMELDGFSFTPRGYTWRYDIAADEWTARATMPAGAERGASFVGAIDGTIYVAGGLGVGGTVAFTSAYIVAEDRWVHPLAPLPAARDHGAGAAVGGALFAITGRNGGFSDRVDIYDPVADEWSVGEPIPTPRAGVATAVLGNEIVVIGGEDLEAPLPGVFEEVEAYDPVSDTWRALAPMRTPRHGMGAATVQDRIYVPGGATQRGFGATAVHEVLIP